MTDMELDHPEWLDEERRRIDETTVTIAVVQPLCPCRWVHDEDEIGEKWILAKRHRECEFHGEHGAL